MTFQNKDMGGFRELDLDEVEAVSGGTIVVTAVPYTPPTFSAGLGSFAATLSSIGNAVATIRDNPHIQNSPLSITYAYYSLAEQLATEEEFDALAMELEDQPFLSNELKLRILNDHLPADVNSYFVDDNGNFVNEIVVTGQSPVLHTWSLAHPYAPYYLTPGSGSEGETNNIGFIPDDLTRYSQLGLSYVLAGGIAANSDGEEGVFVGVGWPGVTGTASASTESNGFGWQVDARGISYSVPFATTEPVPSDWYVKDYRGIDGTNRHVVAE